MRDSIELLRRAGHSIFLLGTTRQGNLPDVDGVSLVPEIAGLTIHHSPFTVHQARKALLKELDRLRPDLVHLIDQFEYRIMRSVSQAFPTVLTAHTFAPSCPASHRNVPGAAICPQKSGWGCLRHHHEYGCLAHFKNDFRRALAIEEYRRKRAVIGTLPGIAAISRVVEQTLLEDGFRREQVHLVYNPVNVPAVAAPLSEAPRTLLLCAARLVPLKGIDHLLRAASRVRTREWALWIAGDGEQRSEYEALARELDVESRVRFLGRVDYPYLQRLYASARAVAQTNLGPETFGLTVAEASAHALPVVGYDVPAINEIVESGKTGILVPPGDIESLTSAIEELLGNEQLAKNMGAAGRSRMLARFSPALHLEQTLALYQHSLSATRRAA